MESHVMHSIHIHPPQLNMWRMPKVMSSWSRLRSPFPSTRLPIVWPMVVQGFSNLWQPDPRRLIPCPSAAPKRYQVPTNSTMVPPWFLGRYLPCWSGLVGMVRPRRAHIHRNQGARQFPRRPAIASPQLLGMGAGNAQAACKDLRQHHCVDAVGQGWAWLCMAMHGYISYYWI